MLIECDQVRNIDVAKVLLRQHIFSYLIAVYEDIVEVEFEYEIDELLLNLAVALLTTRSATVFAEKGERVH